MKLCLAISVLFAVVFTITGPIVQFFPLFLSETGLSSQQISWAMSFVALSKIFSTFFVAFFIDRSPKPHFFLAAAAGFTALIWLCISVFDIEGLWLVGLTLAYSLFWSSAVPLCEGFSVRVCRLRPDIDYGRMRLFGSAAFVISGFMCGLLIEKFGINIFPYYIVFWCAIIISWSFFMPNIYKLERQSHLELPSANMDVIKSLLSNKDFLFVIFGAGIMHAGHALLFQVGAIDWVASGFEKWHIPLFFSIGVMAEIFIFRFSSHLEKNFSTSGFFIIAGIASFIRWFGMAQNPSFELIICLQLLHGFTFGILHLGCIRYFKANLRSGTLGAAQLIYGGVLWGVVMIPAAFISGYFHEHYGLKAYYAMSLLALVGTGIIFLANNLVQKNKKPIEQFCK